MVAAVRNIAIIALLALAVVAIPGGDTTTDAIFWIFGLIFLFGIAWFVMRLYREHRASLYMLGDRVRGILYGAIGVIVLTLTATSRLFDTGVGIVVWFALMGAASYGLYYVWRAARAY